MATLYISEYKDMPVTIGQFLPVAQEPAITTQTVAITTTTQSAAFNTNTRFIRVHVDAICSIKFGASPTAVTTDARMAANTTEYFGVIAGQKLAVVTNT
jgi:hypothetical protein